MTPPTPTGTREGAGPRPLVVMLAAVGAGLAIFALSAVRVHTGWAVLIPSFGSSCTMVFTHPESPFSRPSNVIGGHLVSSALGLLTLAICGSGPLALGVGVGLAIVGMMATRTMHPPAGGDPLIVISTGASPMFLLVPVLAGTVAIMLIATAYRSFSAKVADWRKADTIWSDR